MCRTFFSYREERIVAAQNASETSTRVGGTVVRGSNQSGMRAHNERLVLSLIRRNGALPKAEIARLTGLSAQTISVIMRALEGDGLLERGNPIRGRVGQPSIPMNLAARGAFFFGLKVGRRSADLILIDFRGEILGRVHQTHTFPTPDAMVTFALESINQLTGQLSAAEVEKIAGLGIAIPFRLWDWAKFIGASASIMETWRTRDIQAELVNALPFPVYLENDASAACAAELVLGKTGTPSDFLHFYIGYFIGGGVVLNNALYTGSTGNAGALGPMPVPAPGGGMRPLLEVASLGVLARVLADKGLPSESLWNPPEAWEVDADVLSAWIDETADGLAYASAAACSVLDLEAVLIDGWLPAKVRARLVAATARAVERIDLTGIEIPEFREGFIGPDARSLGAASLPLSERYLVDRNALLKAT